MYVGFIHNTWQLYKFLISLLGTSADGSGIGSANISGNN